MAAPDIAAVNLAPGPLGLIWASPKKGRTGAAIRYALAVAAADNHDIVLAHDLAGAAKALGMPVSELVTLVNQAALGMKPEPEKPKEMTPAEKRHTWHRITRLGSAWRFNKYAERAAERR